MTHRHTPGPWAYWAQGKQPHGQPASFAVSSEHWRIADCRNLHEQGEANARLIAAAPDLLEALENLENDNNAIPEHAWNIVLAAINKARGE